MTRRWIAQASGSGGVQSIKTLVIAYSRKLREYSGALGRGRASVDETASTLLGICAVQVETVCSAAGLDTRNCERASSLVARPRGLDTNNSRRGKCGTSACFDQYEYSGGRRSLPPRRPATSAAAAETGKDREIG